jgi:hypothetical protein
MITTEFKRVKSANYPHIEKDDETFCKCSLIVLSENNKEIFKASYEADLKTQQEFKDQFHKEWLNHLEFFALSQCCLRLPVEVFDYRKKLRAA